MHFLRETVNDKTSFMLDLNTQAFSSIDKKKDLKDLGIVYPFDPEGSPENYVSASSIIDHHNGDYELLKHTEVRVCNKQANDLVYDKINVSTSVVILDQKASMARKQFDADSTKDKECYIEQYNNLTIDEKIYEIYKKHDTYKFFSPDNVTEKVNKSLFKVGDSFKNSTWREPYHYTRYEETLFDDELNSMQTKKIKFEDVENKAEKILSKWNKVFLTDVTISDIISDMWDYDTLETIEKSSINGVLEYIYYCNTALEQEKLVDFRKRKKYDTKAIKKDSDKIYDLIEKYFDSEGLF